MNIDEIQKLIDDAGNPNISCYTSTALSLRAIAQLMIRQARGDERAPALAAAIEPLRESAKNIGEAMNITPTAALDGALVSWPPIRSWDRGEERGHPDGIPHSILENAYDYFEHFCAAGWMLDLRFKGMENQRDDGHAHKPTLGKKCCRLCGIDWRRVQP